MTRQRLERSRDCCGRTASTWRRSAPPRHSSSGRSITGLRASSLTSEQPVHRLGDSGGRRRTGISMPIIFLSGRDSFPRPRRSSEGAVECLAAPVNKSMLVDAVMRASARAFTLESRRRVIHDTEVRLARLTGREREVCDLLTRRLVNRQEVAYELGTTEKTVMAHRGRSCTSSRSIPWMH